MAAALRRKTVQLITKKSGICVGLNRSKATQPEPLLTSVYQPLSPCNLSVTDFVWQNLDRWPDKTATVCAVTGHGYTYAQTHRMSVLFAASLRTKLKLQNDDKVAVILPNIPEYPCALLGVLQAGGVASMMNPIYTAREFEHQLELIDAKAIIASKIAYPSIKEALTAMKKNIPVILVENEDLPEGTIKFAEWAEDQSINTDCLKGIQRSPNDVAVIPFSSGTTGLPKGVVISHRSLVAINRSYADPEIVVIGETTATYQAVLPAILPFFHIFGFTALLLNQMYLGAKLVTLPYFKPDLFLKTVAGHKANALFIVPPMVVFLGKHPLVTPQHLESVNGIISGAAPLSDSDVAAVLAKNKNMNFRQGYGLTETCGGITIGTKTDVNHSAAGHVVHDCEIKIADLNTNEALPAGQEGEIWCRGTVVMDGYYRDEKANRETFTEDGWLRTGDIGKFDDNKFLYCTDRLKELIKVKGFQVAPAELETIIRTHPKVMDCAVLGIPDPLTGEVPKAFIVPQANQTVLPEEIMEYVNNKVTTFKQIKHAQLVDNIPKSPAGKILRRVLKQQYA